ncbi:unnamed protein product [Mesocestoides corti]|uniref:Uncharacterized protein n=1 Tax=Mesocestoides corti TaxID=53468 RepID=A0A0R3U2J9_MESCO|nr:unnamed protein product [Mesocestoides corti]
MDGWVYSVLLLTLLSAVVNAAYEDARCKYAQGVGVNEPSSSGGGPSAVVNRAREQQSRWKGRIEAQRDRVFNERTILN